MRPHPGLPTLPFRDGYGSADGYIRIGRLQICFGTITTGTGSTTAETFAAAFADSNYKVDAAPLSTTAAFANDNTRSTTGCNFDAWDDAGSRVAVAVHYVAIGVWS